MRNNPFNIYGKIQALAELHSDEHGFTQDERIAQLFNEFNIHKEEYSELKDSLTKLNKIDLLWKNASVTSGFNEQTIPLDLSKYTRVMISFAYNTQDTSRTTFTFPIDANPYYATYGFGKNAYRALKVSSTGVLFNGASYFNLTDGSYRDGGDNTYLIPDEIYGIH